MGRLVPTSLRKVPVSFAASDVFLFYCIKIKMTLKFEHLRAVSNNWGNWEWGRREVEGTQTSCCHLMLTIVFIHTHYKSLKSSYQYRTLSEISCVVFPPLHHHDMQVCIEIG